MCVSVHFPHRHYLKGEREGAGKEVNLFLFFYFLGPNCEGIQTYIVLYVQLWFSIWDVIKIWALM